MFPITEKVNSTVCRIYLFNVYIHIYIYNNPSERNLILIYIVDIGYVYESIYPTHPIVLSMCV